MRAQVSYRARSSTSIQSPNGVNSYVALRSEWMNFNTVPYVSAERPSRHGTNCMTAWSAMGCRVTMVCAQSSCPLAKKAFDGGKLIGPKLILKSIWQNQSKSLVLPAERQKNDIKQQIKAAIASQDHARLAMALQDAKAIGMKGDQDVKKGQQVLDYARCSECESVFSKRRK